MAIAQLLKGRRPLHSEDEVLRRFAQGGGRALLIFDTDRQRTWLIATPTDLQCVLDDVREPEPRRQWSEPKGDLGGTNIQLTFRDTEDVRYGLVDISNRHRSWYYSKSIHVPAKLRENISALMK